MVKRYIDAVNSIIRFTYDDVRASDNVLNPGYSATAIRILDVNANRATEGLRVVEEHLRFEKQDRGLCSECKAIRHEVSRTVAQLVTSEARLACRSTDTDVGTQVSATDEYQRNDARSIVLANIKRAAESLRVLEEYSKLGSAEIAVQFEALRYRTYTLEKSLGHLVRASQALAHAQLYLLIDASFGFGKEFRKRVDLVLESGVDVVQLRAKETAEHQLVPVARELSSLFNSAGKQFVVNDRADIARVVNAQGLHVGQTELSVADARTVVGADTLIGVSTHSVDQAIQARRDGADYIGVGPVFPSKTKDFKSHVGVDLIKEISQAIELPFFAIGGIREDNLAQVLIAGATRVAVGHAIWHSENILATAKRMKSQLTQP